MGYLINEYTVGKFFAARCAELNIVAYGETQEEANTKLNESIKTYNEVYAKKKEVNIGQSI
jgi:predicted RNase H-like HicB family nuclease